MTGSRNRPAWRRRWKLGLPILAVVIILLGVGAVAWSTDVQRHKASNYGITDPSSAAVRVENRTSDFAIARVLIEDVERPAAVQDVLGEIGVGGATTIEIGPGTCLVAVYFVELGAAVPGRPEGYLTQSFTVTAEQAVIVRLQGGRSSPEGMVYLPPELTLR